MSIVIFSLSKAKNVYWAYTDYGVYKYRVVDESRHIWRIYLEQGKFQLATQHCANQVSGGHSPLISPVVDTVLSLVQWWTQSCH
jgi:hypothetical protein